MLITHVDDLCWAVKPGYEVYMDKIMKEFIANRDKVKIGQCRFCGKEIEQFADFSIRVTCKHATETINPIRYDFNGRKLTELATESEIGQMRSVVGSLGWIARQCRPDLSYH
eukprot:5930047-Karenia_brevis.AAC.1